MTTNAFYFVGTIDNLFLRDTTPGIVEPEGISNEFEVRDVYFTFADPANTAYGVPDAAPNVAFSPQPKVVFKDSDDNTLSTGGANLSSVTLSINTASVTGATISGTLTASVASGIATWSNVKIDKPGRYTLKATATYTIPYVGGSYTVTGISNEFEIRDMYFTFNEPASAAYGVPDSRPGVDFSPQPKVVLKDATGTTMPNTGETVTLSIYSSSAVGPGLGGTITKTLSSGVADFTGQGVDITVPGKYTLKASATINGTVVTGVSNEFTIADAQALTFEYPAKSAYGVPHGLPGQNLGSGLKVVVVDAKEQVLTNYQYHDVKLEL